jgi:hypothetical protein
VKDMTVIDLAQSDRRGQEATHANSARSGCLSRRDQRE